MGYGVHHLPSGLSGIFAGTNVYGVEVYNRNPITGARQGKTVEMRVSNAPFLHNKIESVERAGYIILMWKKGYWSGSYTIKLYNPNA